jgi:hypothetical protein
MRKAQVFVSPVAVSQLEREEWKRIVSAALEMDGFNPSDPVQKSGHPSESQHEPRK